MITNPKREFNSWYRIQFLKVVRIYARLYKETNNPKYLEEMLKWGQRTKDMAKNIDGL